MVVTLPPPSVPVLTVTCSLILTFLPILKKVFSPLYFKSCGFVPKDENGKISAFDPIEVFPSITLLP